jgi:F-type H+-transporting ATPase subunit gamma
MTMQQTRQRREAVGTIHDIVGAMRAIAAGRIQGAQRALAAAARYEAVVLQGLAELLAEVAGLPPPDGAARTRMLVVMTSEQPLCGSFNQNVLTLAERRTEELRQLGGLELVIVGQRGVRQLAGRGLIPDAIEAAATSLDGLRDVVKRLSARIDPRYAAGQIGALHVIYNRYQSVSEQIPSEVALLPLDPAQLPPVPRRRPALDRHLPRPELLAGLISEYAFIRLYRLAAESFVSEQASRLIAMDGATRNTEQMLQDLLALERRERQGEITRQVLELVAARFAGE